MLKMGKGRLHFPKYWEGVDQVGIFIFWEGGGGDGRPKNGGVEMDYPKKGVGDKLGSFWWGLYYHVAQNVR